MKIELFKFYQYIFDNWADVNAYVAEREKHFKPNTLFPGKTGKAATTPVTPKDDKEGPDVKPAETPTETKADKIAQLKKERIEEIQGFFKDIIKDKDHFRKTLRTLNKVGLSKNTHLEQVLYGNDKDPIETFEFPDDKAIREEFKVLEDQYGYFSKKATEKDYNNFKMLYLTCSLINNNAIDSSYRQDNTSIALQAYKILTIFGGFKQFEQYLNSYNLYKTDNPIANALKYDIPIKSDSFHLSEWQKIIAKTGPDAFKLLHLAPKIEAKLGRAPKSFQEAKKIAIEITYPNCKDYLSLANLSFEYNVPNNTFEQCLQLAKKRKTSDNLPAVQINGAELEYPGYFLVKLPPDDPHAYLLGEITNCCQSIGKASERCVIDGLTRQNNGFYVLLKTDAKADQKKIPLDEKGKIDYKNAEIVGQGYAWISDQHNMTFDSWENLTPSRDDPAIVPMLTAFGKHLTEAKDSSMVRVTIGQGGKTPYHFRRGARVPYAESMLEGRQYEDSINQCEVYCNSTKLTELQTQFDAFLTQTLQVPKDLKYFKENTTKNIEILKNIIKQPCYSQHYIDRVKQFFSSTPGQVFINYLLKKDSEVINDKLSRLRWSDILTLNENNLLTLENWKKIELSSFPDSTVYAMASLAKVGYDLKQEPDLLEKCLGVYRRDAPYFVDNHTILKEANLTQDPLVKKLGTGYADTIKKMYEWKLDKHPRILQALANERFHHATLYICRDLLPKIVEHHLDNNEEFMDKVFEHHNFEKCEKLVEAFVELQKRNLEKNDLIRNAILFRPEDCKSILDNIEQLNKLGLTNEKFIKWAICPNDWWRHDVIRSLSSLKKLNLHQDEMLVDNVLKNYCFARQMTDSFERLTKENIPIDDYIKKCIVNDYNKRWEWTNVFIELHKSGLANHPKIQEHFAKDTFTLMTPYVYGKIIPRLDEMKLEKTDVDKMLPVIFKASSQKECDDLVSALKNLLEMKLEKQSAVLDTLLASPNMSSSLLTKLSRLVKLDLINDADILPFVCKNLDEKSDPVVNSVIKAFVKLKKCNLNTDPECRKMIFANANHADKIANGLFKLINANIPITDAVKKLLLKKPEEAAKMAIALIKMHSWNLQGHQEIAKHLEQGTFQITTPYLYNGILPRLKEFKKENDAAFIQKLFLIPSPKECEMVMNAYTKLNKIDYWINPHLLLVEKAIFDKPIQSEKIVSKLGKMMELKLESDLLIVEFLCQHPDNKADQLTQALVKMREYKLDNDADFRKSLTKEVEYAETIITALAKLSKAAIPVNDIIKKYLLKKPAEASVMADTFIKLQELKLENNTDIQEHLKNDTFTLMTPYVVREIYPQLDELKLPDDKNIRNNMQLGTSESKCQQIVLALRELIEAGVTLHPEVQKAIFKEPTNSSYLIHSLAVLDRNHLANDQDAIKFVCADPSLENVSGLCEMLELLRQAKLDNNPLFREAIFNADRWSSIGIRELKYVLEHLEKFKEYKLQDDTELIKGLLKDPNHSDNIYNAYSLLLKSKVEITKEIREQLFKDSRIAEALAKKIISERAPTSQLGMFKQAVTGQDKVPAAPDNKLRPP